jgi:hypothetical protein
LLEMGQPGGQTGGVGLAMQVLEIGGLHQVLLGFGAGEELGGGRGAVFVRQGGEPAGLAGGVEGAVEDGVVEGLAGRRGWCCRRAGSIRGSRA